MKKKNNKKTLLVFALLLMVGVTTGFVARTYAKYTAEISATGTATVAKWAFATDNTTTTLTIDYDGTYDATTLVDGTIAPGTQGSFDINLVNTNSEVGVDFTVKLGTVTNAPTNIKFYSDDTYTTELTTSTPITGQLTAGDSTGVDVKVYWKWLYETGTVNSTTGIAAGDAADTTDGENAATLSVPVTITAFQTQPGAAITSHID